MTGPLLATILVFLATGGLSFAALLWVRDRRLRRSLVRGLQSGQTATWSGVVASGSRPQGAGEPLLVRFGRLAAKWMPQDDRLRLRLIRAGWDSRTAPLTFAGVRFWLTISCTALSMATAYAMNRPGQQLLLWAFAGVMAGWMLPEVAVQRRTRLRKKRIRKSLPDALDLLVVCVEAGVSLDAAILRVSDELGNTHPDIAHELKMVNHRVNAGMPRIEALRELIERTMVDDIRSIVSMLIQSEKLGVSIGRVLRVEAGALRTKRRQEAEQNARKAPIKMLIPLILFVLPALMTVILGPAGIHLIRVLRTTAQ
jgi:tight adherence protein C